MKRFLPDLADGLSSWFRSWSFLFRHGLAHYFIYPVLLSVVLGMGLYGLLDMGVDAVMHWIEPFLPKATLAGESTVDKVLNFLKDISGSAMRFVLFITGLFLSWKFSKYLVLICMSPIMALLSERVEEKITGKTFPFNGRQFVRDVIRGIGLALRNMVLEILLVLVLMALNLFISLVVPPLTLLATPLVSLILFFVGAYYYGFSVMDYSHERRRLSARQSVQQIRRMKGVACGIGSVFSLLMILPFLGATLATVTCTVAATLAIQEKETKNF